MRKASSRLAYNVVSWIEHVAEHFVPEAESVHIAAELIGRAAIEVYKGWHHVKLIHGSPRKTETGQKNARSPHEIKLEKHAERFALPDEDDDDDNDDDDDDDDDNVQSDKPPTKKTELLPFEKLLLVCASENALVLESAQNICYRLSGGIPYMAEEHYLRGIEKLDCRETVISWEWQTREAVKVARGEAECKNPDKTDNATMRWWRGSVLEKCRSIKGEKWCTSWRPTEDWTDPDYGLPSMAISEAAEFGIPSQPPDPSRRGRPLGPIGNYVDIGGVSINDDLANVWDLFVNVCHGTEPNAIYNSFCDVQRRIITYADSMYGRFSLDMGLRQWYLAIFPRMTNVPLPHELEDYQQLLLQGVICVPMNLTNGAKPKAALNEDVRKISEWCTAHNQTHQTRVGVHGLKLWSAMRIMAEYIKAGWMDYFNCRIRKFNYLTRIPENDVPDIVIDCLEGKDPNQVIRALQRCLGLPDHFWNLDQSQCEDEGGETPDVFKAIDGSTWSKALHGYKRCFREQCGLVDVEKMSIMEEGVFLTTGMPPEARDSPRPRAWKDAQTNTTWSWDNGRLNRCHVQQGCVVSYLFDVSYEHLQQASNAGVPSLQGVENAAKETFTCSRPMWDKADSELTKKVIDGSAKCGEALDAWWWEDKCLVNNCVWKPFEMACQQYHPYHIPWERYQSAEFSGVLPPETHRDWMERCELIDDFTERLPSRTPVADGKNVIMAKDKLIGACIDSSDKHVECGGGLSWTDYLRRRRECNGFWNRATARCLPMRRESPETKTNYAVDENRKMFRCPRYGRQLECPNGYMTVNRGSPGWGGIYNPTRAMLIRWKKWTEDGS
ncbi:putative enterotoxin [Ophiocordyceps camponoti-floridani]|uniref:Putative enterotoxin n=1 Tax=Ophiocordyceps camponoti-floridani TaxID=2030778 RepID=A0A8H4Q0L4_9HYPO|nr:putative enterotoxin [Ophiocordyceps camponoti-floridani]